MIVYSKEYWDDVELVVHSIPNYKNLFGKSILITGGTGMICSAVVEILLYLNKEYSAHIHIVLAGRSVEKVQKRFYPFTIEKDYSFANYDATQSNAVLPEVDYIIHGASNANPAMYNKEPVETMLSNFVGLNSLLKAAKNSDVDRVLYISSSEVYGIKKDNIPFSEEDYGFLDILNFRACYPSSKRASETLCSAYYHQCGIDSVIVRPGHIYGPSISNADSRATAEFTKRAASGKSIIMKSAGTQLRSYCYTLDCGSAILSTLINGESNTAYNISNRNSIISIRDIATLIAEEADVDIVFENPSDSEVKAYNMMENSSLNAEKLESLGWKAIFSAKDGVRRTMKYYQNDDCYIIKN